MAPQYASPARSNSNHPTYRTVLSSIIPEAVLEVPEIVTISRSNSPATVDEEEEIRLGPQKPTTLRFQMSRPFGQEFGREFHSVVAKTNGGGKGSLFRLVDFNLNSVGRSFIDDTDDTGTSTASVITPETPTPNISPSSSNRFSESAFNGTDGSQVAPSTPSIVVSPIAPDTTNPFRSAEASNLCGSWDMLEMDLDFHDVNFDPSYGGDLEECIFFGDDPLGLLPIYPTPPDGVDL